MDPKIIIAIVIAVVVLVVAVAAGAFMYVKSSEKAAAIAVANAKKTAAAATGLAECNKSCGAFGTGSLDTAGDCVCDCTMGHTGQFCDIAPKPDPSVVDAAELAKQNLEKRMLLENSCVTQCGDYGTPSVSAAGVCTCRPCLANYTGVNCQIAPAQLANSTGSTGTAAIDTKPVLECSPGYVSDGTRCVSEVPPKFTCPAGYAVSADGKSCVLSGPPPILCMPGFTKSADGRSCVQNQTPVVTCNYGYAASADGKSCVQLAQCNPPSIRSLDGLSCVQPKLQCPMGYHVSVDGTVCVKDVVPLPPLNCGTGWHLSMDGKSCMQDAVAPLPVTCTNICVNRGIHSDVSCDCICLPCENGGTQTPDCTCVCPPGFGGGLCQYKL